MQRFRSIKTLQKFSSGHAQVHNHLNQERHLITRQISKRGRSAAGRSGGPLRPRWWFARGHVVARVDEPPLL